MEGIFIKKKNNIWSILMLWCGIFLAALYVGLKMVDAEATDGLITLLVLGICCGLVAVPSMLLNRDAYIRVENGTVKAKYHWFGELDCTIAEISFVLPQVNMLTILLKSGKRHVIMGIANAWSVAATIRKEGYRVEEEAPDVIRAEMARAQAARKAAPSPPARRRMAWGTMRPTKPTRPAKLTAPPANAAAQPRSTRRTRWVERPRLRAVSSPSASTSISPARANTVSSAIKMTQKAGAIRAMERLENPPIRKSE